MAIKAEFRSASVEDAVVPPLRIDVDLTGDRLMSIRAIATHALIVTPGGKSIRVGEVKCHDLPISISQTSLEKEEFVGSIVFYLELGPWKLEKLEEIRAGGDLWLQIYAGCSTIDFPRKEPFKPRSESFWVKQRPHDNKFKISKSDWVEHFLGKLGYKRSRLLEIPVLDAPSELSELTKHVDDAWKHYSGGDYEEVLTSCRKGLEVIERYLKDKEFKKTKEVKGEQIPVADWAAFLGGSKIGGYVEKIFDGIKDFTSPGAHAGRVASKPEADYALMCTHGLASYFLKTMSRVG